MIARQHGVESLGIKALGTNTLARASQIRSCKPNIKSAIGECNPLLRRDHLYQRKLNARKLPSERPDEPREISSIASNEETDRKLTFFAIFRPLDSLDCLVSGSECCFCPFQEKLSLCRQSYLPLAPIEEFYSDFLL